MFHFFIYCYSSHCVLHSFPTRRSSDLGSGSSARWSPGCWSSPGASAPACRRSAPAPEDDQQPGDQRSEEHTSELQSRFDLVCRLLLEKKKLRSLLMFQTFISRHTSYFS